MTNPISNYSLVFNAAPYKVIEDKYKGIDGKFMPIIFYILPESFEKGAGLIAEQKKYLAFYEKYLGPFPFRSERVGIVETPHLGMEHSTNIAYGNIVTVVKSLKHNGPIDDKIFAPRKVK